MNHPGGVIIKYNERIYKPGAYHFEVFKETEEQQTMLFPLPGIDAAHDMWQQANARCNAKLYAERKILKASQQAARPPEEKQSRSYADIEEYFKKNGKGTHFLEYEFKPDTTEPVAYISDKTGATKFYWCWTHKITLVSVKRFATQSGKSMDSGRLSKYLGSINERLHPVAYGRAQKVLSLNESGGWLSPEVVTEDRPNLSRKELLAQQVSVCVERLLHSH